MRRTFVLLVILLHVLFTSSPAFADSLSIAAWSQGDSLNSTNLNSRHTTIQNLINGNLGDDNIKSSAGIVGSKLDLTSGTGRISHSTSVTDSAPILSSAQTWNDAAEVFTGWRLSITNTNSASTSRLLDLQVGGTVIASISRVGQLFLNSQDYASGPRTLMDGAWLNVASATYTDNVTAASGTAPRFIAYAFQRPAVAAANSSVTTTDAATVFIASAPVAGTNMTLTSRYALWVDQGDVRIGGAITASGSAAVSGSFQVGTGGSPAGQTYIKSAAAGTVGLVVDTAASTTAPPLSIRVNGTVVAEFFSDGAGAYNVATALIANSVDNGTGAGRRIYLGRNSNGSTSAAGFLTLEERDAVTQSIWADDAGNLRILQTDTPTSGNDLAGGVVGAQTSWHEAKEILRQWDDPTRALEIVLGTKIYDFRYRQTSYLDADDQPTIFTGIVGFDRRDPFLKNVGHHQTPALNEISLHGYTILSIQALAQRLEALEKRIP